MRKPVIQQKPPYLLGSVDKALRLIQTLRDAGSLRIIDAAADLEVSPSTAHRLLSMLVYRGFAIQDDSRTYLPGPSIGERAVEPSGSMSLRSVVTPHLRRLSDETSETSNLIIRVGTRIRFLATVESRNVLRVGDRRGAVLPAERSSGGKALLAELEDPAVQRLYRATDEDPAFRQLMTELNAVRRHGFASNLEATEDGVCAFGAAVHEDGRGVGAISVSFPASRLTPRTREPLIEAVLRTAHAIDADIAGQPVALDG
jgi:DNA-binding IclR family transcriptional regulator